MNEAHSRVCEYDVPGKLPAIVTSVNISAPRVRG